MRKDATMLLLPENVQRRKKEIYAKILEIIILIITVIIMQAKSL